ncbi:MAG: hypothetical protein IKI49_00695 [Oscillospiraceae bacterium]|nr:hypothetical protein [Oscillospiraceae bacterium]
MGNLDVEKMNAVWARVTGAPAACAACRTDLPDDAEKIRAFIAEARRLARFYDALSKKCAVKSARFRCLAADERRNIKRLQTAYFILTGDTCAVRGTEAETDSVLAALREAFIRERANADAYGRAAIESKSGFAAELFSALSSREADHAAELQSMIAELMN